MPLHDHDYLAPLSTVIIILNAEVGEKSISFRVLQEKTLTQLLGYFCALSRQAFKTPRKPQTLGYAPLYEQSLVGIIVPRL